MRISIRHAPGLSCVMLTSVLGVASDLPVADRATTARGADGQFISWREHVIDDSMLAGVEISGSDGLAMADLDGDGREDIVSVHESDTVYDGKPVGHVRIAWASADPNGWVSTTLAMGHEAAAAEDVAIADANGDGHPDVVVACELAHLVYFENPGENARSQVWQRTIPPITVERGSYIRAFFADFDRDGRPEVVAANKGGQNPSLDTPERNNLSVFVLPDDPLDGLGWREQLLGKVRIPINAQPVDLDRDGDLDVVAGSRGEARILWYENRYENRHEKPGVLRFVEHRIDPVGLEALGPMPRITGFNMDYADLDGDGRLDIVTNAWPGYLVWLRQPASGASWAVEVMGDTLPDSLVSMRLADIDGDGDLDAFAGTYSGGPRSHDGPNVSVEDALGRISWFENRGAGKWVRHDVSRRKRGMYDKWLARDLDADGDVDFVGTRGNSAPYDGVIWLEQVRTAAPVPVFRRARETDSVEMPLPDVGG